MHYFSYHGRPLDVYIWWQFWLRNEPILKYPILSLWFQSIVFMLIIWKSTNFCITIIKSHFYITITHCKYFHTVIFTTMYLVITYDVRSSNALYYCRHVRINYFYWCAGLFSYLHVYTTTNPSQFMYVNSHYISEGCSKIP